MKKYNIKELTMIGLCAALMAVFSQISIPLPSGVPITLQPFAVVLISVLLEEKLGTLSILTFILIGAIGMPVFANFNSGFSAILGPTGGFLTGFLIMSFIIGAFSKSKNKKLIFIGAYLGLLANYVIGVLQLSFVLNVNIPEALIIGCYPYILKDLILSAVAVVIALKIKPIIRKELIKVVKV